jgi:hypothetical protein
MLTSALIMTMLMHPKIYDLTNGDKPVYSNSLEAHRAYCRFWLDLIVPRMGVSLVPAAKVTSEYQG